MLFINRHEVAFAVIFKAVVASRLSWPRGAMDNASAYGAEDCRFESCRGRDILQIILKFN